VYQYTGPLHYCNKTFKKEITKCSTIQRENVNRGHAATIIATNVQNSIPFTDTSPEMSFPFTSHCINNCLLYAGPDCTQILHYTPFSLTSVTKNKQKTRFLVAMAACEI